MPPIPDIDSLIAVVREESASGDPLQQLATASQSALQISDLSDQLLDHFVESCRAQGHTWHEISSVLGVSRQAAHKRFTATPPNFSRFTDRARSVLRSSIDAAREFGQGAVGTEHVLLALFEPAEALAAQVLHEAGVTMDAVRERLRVDPAAGVESQEAEASVSGDIGYSPRAIRLLRHAVEDALKFGHNYVGTEHLLLALFDEPESFGARILESFGLDYDDLYRRLGEKFAAVKRSRGTA